MIGKEDIELRWTYTRELKALKLKVRFMNHPTRMKEGKKTVIKGLENVIFGNENQLPIHT